MNKVKAGLRGLNPLEKATRAAIVYNHMNGNPDFPTPSPSMAQFHAAYIELKEANLAALDRGRRAIARRDSAVQRMNEYLTRLAGYVNSTCLGDTLKLAGSGFELVKRAEPISSLNRPEQLQVRPTAFPGQLKLHWERVPGALIYQVERALHAHGEPEQWERVRLTSRPQLILDGFAPYVQETFRVCAVGTKTQSPYSPPAFGKAA
jgi:hypothetical protein